MSRARPYWLGRDYRAAVSVASHMADVSRLPEWMQAGALGRDLHPLGELAVEALIADGWRLRAPRLDPAPLRVRASYWLRPFDQHLDRRRWRWATPGCARSRRWLDAHPEVVEAVRRG